MNAPWFIPGIDFSDHLNYWQHDIPAIMITDTAFYRNKQYHLPGDTADRLNYQKMAQVVDGVIRSEERRVGKECRLGWSTKSERRKGISMRAVVVRRRSEIVAVLA